MAAESKPAVIAAVTGNLLIATTKFIAAAFTGSSAMLSEGIHSVVDTGNGLLMLYGLDRSRRPPDEQHPFGHGRELYFWSLVVAVSIFGAGGGVSIFEGINHLLNPEPIENVTWSYVVIGLSMLFEGASWTYGWKVFRRHREGRSVLRAIHRSKDPSIFLVVLEDSAALAGLVVALAGVYLGHTFQQPAFDGAASIVIGVILAGVALFLGAETRGLLIGEAVDPETRAGIRRVVAETPRVAEISKMMTIHLAPHEVALTLEVRFSPRLDTAELREATNEVAARVQAAYPDVKRVYFAPT